MSNLNLQIQELEAPGILGALPDLPGGQENLLPVEQLYKPLLMSVPDWDGVFPTPPNQRVRLELLVNDVRVYQFDFITPIDPKIFPLQLPIEPKYFMVEGRYKASYSLTISANSVFSQASFFTVDKTPPNAGNPGQQVGIPDEVEQNGITTAYLAENNDSVPIVVSKYIDQRAGDVISLRLGNFASPPVVNCTVHDSNSDTVIPVKGEIIRVIGNGLHYFFYSLKDRARNVGPISQYRAVNIVLDQK
ncbi:MULTISPECIES: hypothetical protein [unclassified Pseudomonas]|uniref:hypothetical protein n=1 Tax=unclassified Pseudomonas TaxID=196821 RepID=UPI000270B3FB|nr:MULTISPECIES: hypothetical protein [unclassified Pseudomonas]EJM92351.1 hypothetical protein PMI33_00608 [Pseudomonas sp. GM67]MBD9545505.1 hypothetical protein [Pseudomonas sp. PDM01]